MLVEHILGRGLDVGQVVGLRASGQYVRYLDEGAMDLLRKAPQLFMDGKVWRDAYVSVEGLPEVVTRDYQSRIRASYLNCLEDAASYLRYETPRLAHNTTGSCFDRLSHGSATGLVTMFINSAILADCTWQAFERLVTRLTSYLGYSGIRAVGQSNDGGADLIAHRDGKRWLFQIRNNINVRVGPDVLDRTLQALRTYRADVPVVVSARGFTEPARQQQRRLMAEGIPMQLWDRQILLARTSTLTDQAFVDVEPGRFDLRPYQQDAIRLLVDLYLSGDRCKAMVVMATGLGKTVVAAEAIRRISAQRRIRVLTIAHTNDLVYQLERAFWPFLRPSQDTVVWNGYERPTKSQLDNAAMVFGCLPTVADHLRSGRELEPFT